MESLDDIVARIRASIPAAVLEVIPNGSSAQQPSVQVDAPHAAVVAQFLRDDASLRLDYCSNVTGVDWLDQAVKEKVMVRKAVDGQEKDVEETVERKIPGHLEVVYHLYSMRLKHGPVILRQRTADRTAGATVSSLTPVWRSCEFQEREVFDLYGVRFDGHPDLRRILMWDGFEDHPMRKDYVDPDDYEYEPTPHDEVLERAKRHAEGGC